MRTVFAILIILCVLATALPVMADKSEVGRYQAIRIDANTTLIIDTKEGHLWMWAIEKRATAIIYMGKVRTGKTIGEFIEWKSFKRD